MRAAHHHGIGLTAEIDVIGIAPLAAKQHGVLRARDRLANRKPVVNAKLGSISVVVHRLFSSLSVAAPHRGPAVAYLAEVMARLMLNCVCACARPHTRAPKPLTAASLRSLRKSPDDGRVLRREGGQISTTDPTCNHLGVMRQKIFVPDEGLKSRELPINNLHDPYLNRKIY